MGRGGLELAQTLLRVALAWHSAVSSTPKDPSPRVNDSLDVLPLTFSPNTYSFLAIETYLAIYPISKKKQQDSIHGLSDDQSAEEEDRQRGIKP